MKTAKTTSPQEICEQLLRRCRQCRIDQHLLPSEVNVIDRLLQHGLELKPVYAELHRKLGSRPPGLEVFFDALLGTAAFWSPEKMAKARADRQALVDINRRVDVLARELSRLFQRRSKLRNESGFSDETHYHIFEVIDAASEENGFYQTHLREKLKRLNRDYDRKYWPPLSDIMDVLALDAAQAKPVATDEVTEAATASKRASKADFLAALLVILKQNSAAHGGFLPKNFTLTDSSLATLMRCALVLKKGSDADGPYVKRFRQRQRQKA